MPQIPSARSDFLDEKNNNRITREWYIFLSSLANGTAGSDTDIYPEGGSSVATQAAADASKALLAAFEAPLPSAPDAETLKRVSALELNEAWPHALQSDIGQINQRLAALELDDGWPYARNADVKQVNQRVSDLEVTVAMAVGGGGTNVGDVIALIEETVDAVFIEGLGYWSPLTNGDPVTPELIFDSFGDTVMTFTPTP